MEELHLAIVACAARERGYVTPAETGENKTQCASYGTIPRTSVRFGLFRTLRVRKFSYRHK